MGKKLKTNSKAVEARERKATAKAEAQYAAEKAAEDSKWVVTDKKVLAKEAKKAEEERKKADAARRKEEARMQVEAELAEADRKKPTPKVTQAQIREMEEKRRAAAYRAAQGEANKSHNSEWDVERNPNHALADEEIQAIEEGVDMLNARSTEDAINVLSGQGTQEDSLAKRAKAAYNDFVARESRVIQLQNPGLRMSQIKERLHKKWQKSPDNPMNQKR